MSTALTSEELMQQASALHAGLQSLPSNKRFNAKTLDAVYAMAYNLVRQGLHERAMPYFAFLTVYAPTDARNLAGLALTHQLAGNHAEALYLYSLASFLQSDRPAFAVRMAECFLRLGDVASARAVLGITVRYCEQHPSHETVRERAQAIADLLSNERAAA